MAFAAYLTAEMPANPSLSAGAVTPSFTAVTLDAANEYCGMAVPAPKAGTIKKVLINIGTVTTGATLDVTIEGVSATTGGPDGSPLTNGTTTLVVTTGDASTQMTATFSTGPTVTQGQLIAVKINNPSSSPGNLQINVHTNSLATQYFPYSFTALTALSKSRNAPLLALEYSDGSYAFIPGVLPASAFTTDSVGASTTPDEIGMKFAFPMPVKVRGIWWQATSLGSNTLDIVLYDSDGSTVLETVTVDSEQVQTTSAGYKRLVFTNEYELSKDTFYRVVLKPNGTISFGGVEVGSAAAMDGFEGGQDFHRTERTDAGSWTDTTTKRPWMGLAVSAFDDGASGGGGSGGVTRARLPGGLGAMG